MALKECEKVTRPSRVTAKVTAVVFAAEVDTYAQLLRYNPKRLHAVKERGREVKSRVCRA